jgi:hypothetical protein
MGVIVPNPTVTEVDGSPEIKNVKTIKVSNTTLTDDGSRVVNIDTTGTGGVPGGSDTEIQYNDGGSFEGSDKLTFDDANGVVELTSPSTGGTANIHASTFRIDGGSGTATLTSTEDDDGLLLCTESLDITGPRMLFVQPATGSGAISITTGEDGSTNNIELTAGGTGDVIMDCTELDVNCDTLSLPNDSIVTAAIDDDAVTVDKIADDAVGVDQLSATGTPSASTFLRGDNTWDTPAGGGGASFVSTVGYRGTQLPLAGRAPFGTGANTTMSFQNANMYYYPFVMPCDLTLSTPRIYVTSAPSASQDLEIAIYSSDSNNGYPDAQLTKATIALSATGYNTGSSWTNVETDGDELTGGTLYWFGTFYGAGATDDSTVQAIQQGGSTLIAMSVGNAMQTALREDTATVALPVTPDVSQYGRTAPLVAVAVTV